MRNQKWNQFAKDDRDIPQAGYEACVFIDNAINHIRHVYGNNFPDATFRILIKAHEDARLDIMRLAEAEVAA